MLRSNRTIKIPALTEKIISQRGSFTNVKPLFTEKIIRNCINGCRFPSPHITESGKTYNLQMKELLSSKPGRIAVKVLTWGLVAFVISAAGSGLLFLIMRINDRIIGEALFGFLYGIFYILGFVSFYLLGGSMITLLIMTIVNYSKRYF